jgi:hypothetical protein
MLKLKQNKEEVFRLGLIAAYMEGSYCNRRRNLTQFIYIGDTFPESLIIFVVALEPD